MNFKAVLNFQVFKSGAHGRVIDFAGRIDGFNLRINKPVPVLKKGRQLPASDVAIFVDRGGEHRATMFASPSGVICSADAEGNPKWCLADNHGASIKSVPCT